jgi:CO/xanthine dehydrogenase Mo-binding subunit
MGVVGKRVIRSEAAFRVSGAGMFADDIKYPGMIEAAVVRSPIARGIIKKIDDSNLAELEGFRGIFTYKDIPGKNCIPIVIDDQPFLAEQNVNYIGEPIAVVVADNRRTARAAAVKTELILRQLPTLLDPLEARNHPDVHIFGENNIFKQMCIRRGDINSGFAASDIIVENEYQTPYQEHAYIEPQAMMAIPYPDGSIEIRGSMQCPFYVRKAITTILGLPESKVRVIQTATGGAFGGKEDVPSLLACQVALPAWKLKRPVKLVYDRKEDIISMSKRHPAWIRYKSGMTGDGVLKAVEAEYIIDGGAYATLSGVVLFRGTAHSVGPYKCDNVKVDSYAVATNKVPAGAFRGFGSPQILFAVESQMDELAYKLGIDPVEIRRRNILRRGDTTVTGQKLNYSTGLEETLDKVIQVSGWSPKQSKADGVGFGISTILYGMGLGAGGKMLARTGARVMLHADGSVLFSVGTTEIGQGMTTVLSQITADELGVPFSAVEMMPTDTSRVPDSGPTVASRSTTMSGNALKDACIKIKSVLLGEAAEFSGYPISLIKIDDGIVTAGDKTMPLLEIIKSAYYKKRPLTAEGWYVTPPTSFDEKTGQGEAYVAYAWATNLVKLKVDRETGEILVLKIWSAHDIGKAINPTLAEGQIEGGVLQGLGYALTEDMTADKNGAIRHSELSTYIIPTSADEPEIIPIIIEDPFPDGPYGAKGFGEQPLMGIAPAVANAVFDAVGVRIRTLPVSPEKVWKALNENKI